MSNLTEQLSKEKDKYKALWKINLFLSEKERELSWLRDRILELEGGSIPKDNVSPPESRSSSDLNGAGSESSRSSDSLGEELEFMTITIRKNCPGEEVMVHNLLLLYGSFIRLGGIYYNKIMGGGGGG